MKVLFADREIAVIVKPFGVLSEGDEGESVPALLAPELGALYPVHRLDRAASGVMVYARTKEAAARLSDAFRAGKTKKEYTVVTAGVPAARAGEMRDLLYHDPRANKTFRVETKRSGAREAALLYRVENTAAFEGESFAEISVRLLTGRTHQIRAQFASRALPLVGDGKYGSRVKAPHIALFARALSFPHPKSGKALSFDAPLPDEFPFLLFGAPHYEIERKFLVAYPNAKALAAMPHCRVFQIEQTYLCPAEAGATERVRKVTEGDKVSYIHTIKRRVNALRAIEEEKRISEEEYAALLARRDVTLRTIRKTRYAFPFGGRTVEVDLFDFWSDRAVAEVEIESEESKIVLPPFLTVLADVSEDARYKNVNLARSLP